MSESKEAPVYVAFDDGTTAEMPGLVVTVAGEVTAVDRLRGTITIQLSEVDDADEFEVGCDVSATTCFMLSDEESN